MDIKDGTLEPTEPELTPAETKEQDIARERDAEQVRVHALSEHGTPMKYMIIRSTRVAEEVVKIPQYYELKDGDDVIGYQRWGEDVIVQDRGTLIDADLNIVGERQRGE